MASETNVNGSPIKAVLFDFMGTCLDWHTTVTAALPMAISESDRSALAIEWRHAYFAANAARLSAGLPPEDIDITHRRVLDSLLAQDNKYSTFRPHFTTDATDAAIQSWHHQKAWPDVRTAIRDLREQGYEVFVHANGTVRLQLDLIASSGLTDFHMLFSSQLLGYYKPAPESYAKALALIKRQPQDCVMVAAHEYDLRGAREAGMKTVYVYRWTDDVNEDQEVIRTDNDAYLEGMSELSETITGL